MVASILYSIKKLIGVDINYNVFDDELVMYINGSFNTLFQLGVGPLEGFTISGPIQTWSQLTNDDKLLECLRTYVYLKTRLVFDPPATSFGIEAFEKQAQEWEWRICAYADGSFTDPNTPPLPEFIDGGNAASP